MRIDQPAEPDSSGARSDARITLIGPMPPPIDGQSIVMSHMVSRLTPHFPNLRVSDTTERASSRWRRAFVKLGRSAAAWGAVLRADVVYIAVKADHGMWLTTVTAGLARLTGKQIFLHHHSYTYIRERRKRMSALARIAGPTAQHIVLSQSMSRDLRAVMPEISRTLIIGNAALVDQTLLELPLKSDADHLVLGHLSNLYLDKGIGEVVDLAIDLHAGGVPVRLIVGGPLVEPAARHHIERGTRHLGELFEYRGPLAGEMKRAFFEEITHFIFPSKYSHESVPLVLYEAMAAGVVCVSTRRGSIPEQLAESPGILADSKDTFVQDVLPVLRHTRASSATSYDARQAYLKALAAANDDLARFVSLLGKQHGRSL
ncbi:MAG: glycosyltransferase family 4 protein [Verrucomicrobia bacterium]|nr:glycosyltransferase family 4 protein [Verrucomicrobiota bacterium]